MKNKVVIVPFPFDDLSSQKVRPAVCLTDEIKPYGHVVLAFITSKVSANLSDTDFVIDLQDADFFADGLESFFNGSASSFNDSEQKNYQTRTRRIIKTSTVGNRKPSAKII